jgi:hypothetical protein
VAHLHSGAVAVGLVASFANGEGDCRDKGCRKESTHDEEWEKTMVGWRMKMYDLASHPQILITTSELRQRQNEEMFIGVNRELTHQERSHRSNKNFSDGRDELASTNRFS